MKRTQEDAIILGGDGGFLVRGTPTDDEFMETTREWLGDVTKTGHIRRGWYRWVPNPDEGGVLLWDAKPHARGAFQAAVVDWVVIGDGEPQWELRKRKAVTS